MSIVKQIVEESISSNQIRVLVSRDTDYAEPEIIYILLTGSSVFVSQEERKKDLDYVVLLRGGNINVGRIKKLIDGIRYDIFIYEEDYIKEILSHRINNARQQYWNLYYNLIEPEYDLYNLKDILKFDFIKYKTEYETIIKEELIQSVYFPNQTKFKFYPQYKKIAIPYVYISMIKNNLMTVTEGMKEKVKNLYLNGDMEIFKEVADYFDIQINYDGLVLK